MKTGGKQVKAGEKKNRTMISVIVNQQTYLFKNQILKRINSRINRYGFDPPKKETKRSVNCTNFQQS